MRSRGHRKPERPTRAANRQTCETTRTQTGDVHVDSHVHAGPCGGRGPCRHGACNVGLRREHSHLEISERGIMLKKLLRAAAIAACIGVARAGPDTRYKCCEPAGGSSDHRQGGILGLRHEVSSSSLASSSSSSSPILAPSPAPPSSSPSTPLPPSPSPRSPPLSLSPDFAETQWPGAILTTAMGIVCPPGKTNPARKARSLPRP
jgi:hypothetical protein